MLEHQTRRQQKTRTPRPAHQLDRHDAVAAEFEEVVVQPHTTDPQHLGEQSAQHRLRRRPRRPVRPRRTRLRRRQRTAVELAVLRQRQPVQNHERRRHHVVRKRRRQRQPKLRHIRHRPRRRHHITHQPTLAAALRRPRNHCSRRHTRLPDQQGLDLARLDPEPAKLYLRVRAAQKLQNPVRTTTRKVTGPVHPRTRHTVRVGNKPLRRQARTMQITARKAQTRNVKLANNARRNRLKIEVQDVGPIVREWTADGNIQTVKSLLDNMPDRVDRRFSRTVEVGDLRNW